MNKKRTQEAAGTLEDTSPEQLQCLETVRSDLRLELSRHPEFNTTWSLLRFCRARGFDSLKAKLMIRKYIDFLEKTGVDRITELDFAAMEPIFANYAKGLFGTDYEGRLIVIDKASLTFPKKVFQAVTDNQLLYYLIRVFMFILYVAFPKLSAARKKRTDRIFHITDLKDTSILQFFDSKVMGFVKISSLFLSDYYPEILGQSFIINCPLIFKGVWAVAKNFLDKRTQSKIVLESGPGLSALSKFMNVDDLPTAIGGKNPQPISMKAGPWAAAFEDAVRRKSFYLEDRSFEYEYFYTKEERERLSLSRSLCLNGGEDNAIENDSFEGALQGREDFRPEAPFPSYLVAEPTKAYSMTTIKAFSEDFVDDKSMLSQRGLPISNFKVKKMH